MNTFIILYWNRGGDITPKASRWKANDYEHAEAKFFAMFPEATIAWIVETHNSYEAYDEYYAWNAV